MKQTTSGQQQLAFLQSAYKSAEIGICVVNADRCFVLVNDAYCDIYGYRRDELIGQPFTMVLPEELREKANQLHDDYLAGGQESAGEWQVMTKQGNLRNVIITASRVITDEGERFKVTTVQDISVLRAQESKLEKLSRVVAQTQHGVVFTDAEGLVTWVNEGFETITGYGLERALGRKPGEFLQGERTDPETVSHMSQRLAAGEGFQVEIINYAASGREYWLHIACSPVLDRSGKLEGFMALQTDITEHKRFKQRIEQLSFQDSLTGLPNRRLVEEQLKFRMGSSQRSRLYQALLLLDLAARFGGDEFVVVLADLSSDPDEAAERVESVAARLLRILAEPFGQSGLEHRVTASMGAVLFVGNERTIDEVLQQSDIAMYQAKAAGKNSFAFFDPSVRSELLKRHRIEVELREAIQSNQLVPFYQGQFDTEGHLIGAELLIRWQHPVRGLLAPGEFIPVAEACGLIVELGYQVIGIAVEQLQRWAGHEKTAGLSLSVNISARHFEESDFRDRVAAVLADYQLPPALLKLEITESALAHDLKQISATMHALKKLGVSFSLDDFGTGYSSLAYLKLLPIEQVKIDQSFVRDLLVDDNDRGITEAICALARALKMEVIAEGVEVSEQRDVLVQLGCRRFQGYFFHRPEPLSAFSDAFSLNQK